MSTNCASCGELFGQDDYVQPLPSVLQLRMGEKSGQLGWYPEGNPETEYVHVECMNAYYQAENTPIWDAIDNNIRESIRENEREEIREEAMREFAESGGLICRECLDEMDQEEANDNTVLRQPLPTLPFPVTR